MPFSLLPREESFFNLFTEVARRSHGAAEHLAGLFAEPERAAYHAEQIKRLEHECDQITHEVVNRLDRTFITPIDREDIFRLASDLDDVIDAIDGVARRTQLFKVGPAPDAAKRLTAVIQQVVGALLKSVEHLKNRDGVMEASTTARPGPSSSSRPIRTDLSSSITIRTRTRAGTIRSCRPETTARRPSFKSS